jgi:hypothetical protein
LKSLLLQIKKRELALSVLLHGEGRSLNTWWKMVWSLIGVNQM